MNSESLPDTITLESSAAPESVEDFFQAGLERYRSGEDATSLIPDFEKIVEKQPKVASGWVCLCWLYLLANQPNSALKAGKQAVKLSPEDPQARINLAIAMLETSQKGVREQVEAAQNWLMLLSDLKQEVIDNFADGHNRRPNWEALEKIRKWVLDS